MELDDSGTNAEGAEDADALVLAPAAEPAGNEQDRTGDTGAGTVWVGCYWERGTWDLARSAYVADLDADPDSPGAFVGWLGQAIEQHAARTPQQRTEVPQLAPAADSRRKVSKGHPLPMSAIEAMEAAIVADRQELGRVLSRSGFIAEAVKAAGHTARERLGHLPPPPARLPNRPPRR